MDLNSVTQKLKCFSNVFFIVVGGLDCFQLRGWCKVLVTDDNGNSISVVAHLFMLYCFLLSSGTTGSSKQVSFMPAVCTAWSRAYGSFLS